MLLVATAPLPAVAFELLSPLGTVDVAGEGDHDRWLEAEVLIVRGERLDEATIDSAQNFRVIARTGSGFDRIAVDAATRQGIPLIYAPVAGTLPVAEGTLALLLAVAKRIGELGTLLRTGNWYRRYDVEILDLDGATLGIIGLGRIGREVARLGNAFGMKVIAFEPSPEDGSGGPPPFVRLVDLDRLAAEADVISLHCNLTRDTRGLIDRAFLSNTKRGAILVNAARGEIVESEAVLLEALESGILRGVGLDVFAIEPPDPSSALLRHASVVCTPHSIGLTRQWNENVFASLARDISAVVEGRMPEHIVNPEVLETSPPDSTTAKAG